MRSVARPLELPCPKNQPTFLLAYTNHWVEQNYNVHPRVQFVAALEQV